METTNDITGPQSPTLLKKLPAELRLMIWEYAIGKPDFHVAKRRCMNVITWTDKCPDMADVVNRPSPPQQYSAFALLFTCKQTHHEVINIIYKNTNFVFTDPAFIPVFEEIISPANLRLIHSVTIQFEASSIDIENALVVNETSAPSSHQRLWTQNAARRSLQSFLHTSALKIYVLTLQHSTFYLDDETEIFHQWHAIAEFFSFSNFHLYDQLHDLSGVPKFEIFIPAVIIDSTGALQPYDEDRLGLRTGVPSKKRKIPFPIRVGGFIEL